MFGQYFGNYLVEKNRISQVDLDDILLQLNSLQVRLGTIAVAEKLMTKKQAEEVNLLQRQMDKRFGDIAIEKGYLLPEELNHLINLQGKPYLKFLQALTDKQLIAMEEIDEIFDEYQKDNQFTTYDLDAIISGDIDRIIPVFVHSQNTLLKECAGLAIRNLVRFVNNNITLKHSYITKEYPFGSLSCQQMIGEYEFFVAFASSSNQLLEIANPFAKEQFSELHDEAFDSVCEFINCINGIFASKLSIEDINIDMTPPVFYRDKSLSSDGEILVVPVIINQKQCDLLISMNHKVEIN